MASGVDVLSGWWWWQRLLYLALVANCYTRTSRDLQQYTQLPLEPDECPLTLFYLFINFNFAKILQVRACLPPPSGRKVQLEKEATIISAHSPDSALSLLSSLSVRPLPWPHFVFVCAFIS